MTTWIEVFALLIAMATMAMVGIQIYNEGKRAAYAEFITLIQSVSVWNKYEDEWKKLNVDKAEIMADVIRQVTNKSEKVVP